MNDDHPSGEVPERARRRTFTAAYKLKVLAEYETAEPGRRGEVLRREGLYSSHLVEWRQARDAGALAGLAASRGRHRPTRSSGTTLVCGSATPSSRLTWTPRGG